VHAVTIGYEKNRMVRKELASDDSQPHESRVEADGYLKKLSRLELLFYLNCGILF